MKGSVTIYTIKLSKRVKEEDFEKFMIEKVFPSISKEATRLGQVTGLTLLKGDNTGHTNEYYWMVYGAINWGPANEQLDRIKAFGGHVSGGLMYVEAGSWSSEENQ